MRRMDLLDIVLFVILTLQLINISAQVKEDKKDVFSPLERVQLPLRYCEMKSDSDLVDKQYVYGHCLKKWNKKYARFCQKTRSSASRACERLKRKMKNAIQNWSMIRTKSYTEHCSVGHYQDKPFDPTIQFCCENRIWKKRSKEQKICCDKVLANGSKLRCCNSSNLSLSSLKRARCCGVKLINEDMETCEDKSNITKSIHILTATQLHTTSTPVSTYSIHKLSATSFSNLSKTPTYHEETISGQEDVNYREMPEQNDEDISTNNQSAKIVYICSSFVFVMLLVLAVFLIRKFVFRKGASSSNNVEMLCFNTGSQHYNNPYGTMTMKQNEHSLYASQVQTHHIQHSVFRNELGQDMSTTSLGTSFSEIVCTHSDENNISSFETVDSQTQTDPRKEINVKNSMGRAFCVHHTFTKSNRSLQIPDSAVKLTLSEIDLQNNKTIECYATSFRNLTENYSKLDQLMSMEEQIVSPAVEFFFPEVKRLKQFACIDMEIGRRDKEFHVWKVKSDQGRMKSKHREEIPFKKYIDVNDDTVDAYYEICDGRVRIYLKTFSWLVCTVCNTNHYGLNVSARIYVNNEPHTAESNQVRVTVYILDGVRQLDDYLKFIAENESSLKLYRKVNLPEFVSLEESFSIRLKLLSETANTWRQLVIDPADMIEDVCVPVKHITQCHNFKSNGQPFSKDWHFESLPYSITTSKFTFQCVLCMTTVPLHPGVSLNIPPNRFLINKEVDLSLKKRHDNGGYGANPINQLHQPLSSFRGTARQADSTELHGQQETNSNNQNRIQWQDINQNGLPWELPNSVIPNIPRSQGTNQRPLQRQEPQPDYEALGARPRTNDNRGLNSTVTGQHITVQSQYEGRNCSSNNWHDSRCRGALPHACSEPSITVNYISEVVRGEFSRSMN